MELNRNGREYYKLTVTTSPATAATDWSASFDGGTTWVTAISVAGSSAWLVAGPAASPTGATVVTDSQAPLVRLLDNPEIVVRGAPRIFIT